MPISWPVVKGILPLSTCYLLNILTGLSATQNLSLPMMVLLRRASILMTMVRNTPTCGIRLRNLLRRNQGSSSFTVPHQFSLRRTIQCSY